MKLLQFIVANGAAQPGFLRERRVHSLAPLGYPDLRALLEMGPSALAQAQALADATSPGDGVPLDAVRLLAPLANARKLIFIGLNYRDHAAEAKMEIPATPTVFAKFSNAVVHPGEPILLPRHSRKPDYEAEFAFVIGKRGKHIPASAWQDYVAGYTIINDVSARDFQLATSQWIMGKTCDAFCPMGPYLTTIDEIADPHNLRIQCLLNGETMQDSNTSELIFKIPELLEHLSDAITLEPGDVISTGTPAGVGFSKKPPRWLQPGDHCVVRIEGLGELQNPVLAET